MIIKKKKERKKDKQTEQSRKIKNRPKYTEPTNRNERAGDEPKFECMHSLQHNKNHVRYEQQTDRQTECRMLSKQSKHAHMAHRTAAQRSAAAAAKQAIVKNRERD